jgi:flagellar biosynthesis chaperone FliJ
MSPDDSSPVPLPPSADYPFKHSQDDVDSTTNENISPLDPRRFTPSLHASLVSEILSLRRDVSDKTKDIEQLEASLQSSRDEYQTVNETFASNSKETRALRRQVQLLEGGTVSALSELSNEREEALSEVAELRKRLDQFQRRARSQEENVERTQTLWSRDREAWGKERRALETKVHIVEGRLKVVLSEITKSAAQDRQSAIVNHHESPKKAHLRQGSVTSMRSLGLTGRRRDSEVSSGTQDGGDWHGSRLSILALPNGQSTSLADELALDEEEEDQVGHHLDQEEQHSGDELLEERQAPSVSRLLGMKARKVLGLTHDDAVPIQPADEQPAQTKEGNAENNIISKIQALYAVKYVDAAVQCSPPDSPELSARSSSLKLGDDDEKTVVFADALSHQEPMRALVTSDSVEDLLHDDQAKDMCEPKPLGHVPSDSSPSMRSPHLDGKKTASVSHQVHMIDTSTQTDLAIRFDDSSASQSPATLVAVPTISIHPPASRPTTPTGNVVLPPHTKNASCQVNIPITGSYTSTSMQTEEIRIDSRIANLTQRMVPPRKPHNLPAEDGVLRRPGGSLHTANPLPNSSRRRLQQPGSVKPAYSRRRDWDVPAGGVFDPTPEDPETIRPKLSDGLKRTSESSGSFAAAPAGDQEHEGDPALERPSFDEEDFLNRPTAKFTLRGGKMVSKDQPEPNYQDIFDKIDAEGDEHNTGDMSTKPLRRDIGEKVPSARSAEPKQKVLKSNSSRQPDIRKAALISSGTAAHQAAPDRGPASPVRPPPFPVPTRHSSRKPPISVSEGAPSPTPGARLPRKKDGMGRKQALRKVRSATNVTRGTMPDRRRSPSPPTLPSQYGNANVVRSPTMPFDDASRSHGPDWGAANKRPRGPVQQYSHSRGNSGSTIPQQTSVVDAIAQTMVGEWMYKYVRRRKSFGVPESKMTDWDLIKNGEDVSSSITNTGVRHKRWVWLAPYDRAVMWSSKQPTSGSALMGKSGRKCRCSRSTYVTAC